MTDSNIKSLEKKAVNAADNYLTSKKSSACHAIECGNALNDIKAHSPNAFDELIKKMPVGLRQCRKFMAIAAARKKAKITGNPGSEFLGINVEARLTNVTADIEKQVREYAKNEHAPQHELVALISKLTAPVKEKEKPEKKEPEPLTQESFITQVQELNGAINSLCNQVECLEPEGEFKVIVDTIVEKSADITTALSEPNQDISQDDEAKVEPELQKAA